jgi:hypothetical protein
MRVLIAEDDQVLADGLLRSLRAATRGPPHPPPMPPWRHTASIW